MVRWKSRKKARAEIGDTRVRKTFAWLPREAEDGFTYWMTPVILHERLMRRIRRKRGGFVEESEKWVAFKTELIKD